MNWCPSDSTCEKKPTCGLDDCAKNVFDAMRYAARSKYVTAVADAFYAVG